MNNDSSFELQYDALTEVQKQAADWTRNSLLVIAGPGSGKTRVLTCRIAKLLRDSSDKKFRVLALTFTNKAAGEMRERVDAMVPGAGARTFIGTFHSFCADVLRHHGSHIGVQPDFTILGKDEEKGTLMNEAVEQAMELNPEVIPSDKAVWPVIRRLKTELVEPDDAPHHVSDPRLKRRITDLYRAFEAELNRTNALDFDSLIHRTFTLFRKFPTFARRYQTVYPYWCIDEFQDTNSAQYALIKEMTQSMFSNIFVVADDDQIIYVWNGASHKRLEEFRSDFDAALLQLPTNYRCPAEIVAIANKLIRFNLLRTEGKKPLESAVKTQISTRPIELLSFRSEEEECSAIAGRVAQFKRAELASVAVLARVNRLLERVADQLRKMAIPFVIPKKRAEFASAQFRWLHRVLRLAHRRTDQQTFEELVADFNAFASVSLNPSSITASMGPTATDLLFAFFRAAEAVLPSEIMVAADQLQARGTWKPFAKAAIDWMQTAVALESDEERAVNFFQQDLAAWKELLHDIQLQLGKDLNLDAFLHELDLRSKEPTPRTPSVNLLSIHGAKGKEFEHVFIIGMAEDILPSFQSKKHGPNSPEMEEERRNCFVAITRTKMTLTLSYAHAYAGWAKVASRFLKEMELIK
jgi:DNA helicase-2/ATP-dependent DNA helicase PcrA